MKCYHCNTELNWESDSTDEDDSRLMLTFLSCHNCPTTVVITHQTELSVQEPHDHTKGGLRQVHH